MRDLLTHFSPDTLDFAGRLAARFVENPFWEPSQADLEVRFGPQVFQADTLDGLVEAGVLHKKGGKWCFEPQDAGYQSVLDWVGGLRGADVGLQQEVVAYETLARLQEKLAVSQEEVGTVLEMVPVGVILLDHFGQVLKANRLGERLTGQPDQIISRLGVLLEDLLSRPFETELDGPPPVAVTTQPFRVAGSDTGVVVVIQDITSKRELALQAEKLREDFFSMIRHELRKPLLTVERSLAQLGKAEGESPLALAQSATEHLSAMIDDMLFLARLERDPLAVACDKAVSLRFLLAGCDLAFRQKATDLGIVFKVMFPDEDVTFWADERRLQQVVGNLVDNALKFTPSGGQVVLSGRLANEAILFDVADSGPGIPAAEREEIFGKFYQVRSDAGRKPGLGLGLAITQEVVSAHGGEIVVLESEWGGALFRVRLPLVRSEGE